MYDARNDRQQNGTFLMIDPVLLHCKGLAGTINPMNDSRNGHHQNGTFLIGSQMPCM